MHENPEEMNEKQADSSVAEAESKTEQNTQSEQNQAAEKNADITSGLAALHQQLDNHLQQTARCSQQAFDRLYEEMQQYKGNFILEVQRGLLSDLMFLYDNVEQLKTHYGQSEQVDIAELLTNLQGLSIETEEIFARRGIELLVETSEKLNIKTQKVVKVVPTDDPTQDKRVVKRVKSGFLLEDRPFRKEEVEILRYTAAPPIAPNSGEKSASDA